MRINWEKPKELSPAIVRWGLSLVILWFGFTNVFTDKLVGYIPGFVYSLGFSSSTVLILNGLFEIAAGTLLLLGIFTRTSSLLVGLHLLLIIPGLGYNDVAARDFGLMVVSFGISLRGKDKFCLGNKFGKKYKPKRGS